MTNTSITSMLFRVIYPGSIETKTVFLKTMPSIHGSSSNSSFQATPNIGEGYPAGNLNINQIIDVLELVTKELCDRGKIDLVEVTINTSINPVNTATDEFMEVRRQKALEKLTLSDIKALGLEKMATYDKLRHYKVDENE